MKKIIILLVAVLMLTGCADKECKPTKTVCKRWVNITTFSHTGKIKIPITTRVCAERETVKNEDCIRKGERK